MAPALTRAASTRPSIGLVGTARSHRLRMRASQPAGGGSRRVVMLIAVIASTTATAAAPSRSATTWSPRSTGGSRRRRSAYLSPAQQFLELADAAAAGRGVLRGRTRRSSTFALHALASIGPAAAFSYADPEGNFLYVMRNEKGGFDSKTIDRRDGGHRVTWTRRDAEGNGGRHRRRSRRHVRSANPAVVPGRRARRRSRSGPTPTCSSRCRSPASPSRSPTSTPTGKLQSVLGVDIELATLCAFLKQLGIGVSGKALIIDRTGRVVAYPSDNWLPADRPDVKAPMLDELGDPVLARAYNRLRDRGLWPQGAGFRRQAHHRLVRAGEHVDRPRLGRADRRARDRLRGLRHRQRPGRSHHVDPRRADRRRPLRAAGLAQRAAERRMPAAADAAAGARDANPHLRRAGARAATGRRQPATRAWKVRRRPRPRPAQPSGWRCGGSAPTAPLSLRGLLRPARRTTTRPAWNCIATSSPTCSWRWATARRSTSTEAEPRPAHRRAVRKSIWRRSRSASVYIVADHRRAAGCWAC